MTALTPPEPPRRPDKTLPARNKVAGSRHKPGEYRKDVAVQIRLDGFWGAIVAVLVLIAILGFFVLGLAALTIALWLAFGVALIAVAVALGRALFRAKP